MCQRDLRDIVTHVDGGIGILGIGIIILIKQQHVLGGRHLSLSLFFFPSFEIEVYIYIFENYDIRNKCDRVSSLKQKQINIPQHGSILTLLEKL